MIQIQTTIHVPADSPVGRLRLGDSAGQWDAAVGHRFVDELFSGTIEDAVLAGCLVQDYQFFDAFLSMLGGCVAHADRRDSKLRFAAQLGMLAADEDGYFQRAFPQLGVAEDDWRNPQLSRGSRVPGRDVRCGRAGRVRRPARHARHRRVALPRLG
ncbi:TenA family protein [Brevibacterium sp. p3-SID960]|uniref:TenA family protein n=1 Tax=Brevibacterium sp. p3-SID960 TaxID=2916063 RepID=UPI0021A6854D|nr:TenA family protein [Brevibacterium sp. p3-SID960]MCT1689470.1 TenA family protein [Brevibacterium sp. p3-SID960]